MSAVLAAARISSPYGWLYLGQGTQYRIGAASFAEQSVTFRRSEVTSPYVEGTFVVNALRENVTETLEIYVEGRESLSVSMATRALGFALTQVTFSVQVQIRDELVTWNAYAADHTVATRRELLHARIAQVTAQVPRDPHLEFEQVVTSTPGTVSADYSNAVLAQSLVGYGSGAPDPEVIATTSSVTWPLPVGV